jgi:hypothetical protein
MVRRNADNPPWIKALAEVRRLENQRRALFGEDYIRGLMNRANNDLTIDELLRMSDADRLLALDQMSDASVRRLVRALEKTDVDEDDEEDDDRKEKVDEEDVDEDDDRQMIDLLTRMNDNDKMWMLDRMTDDYVRRLFDRMSDD